MISFCIIFPLSGLNLQHQGGCFLTVKIIDASEDSLVNFYMGYDEVIKMYPHDFIEIEGEQSGNECYITSIFKLYRNGILIGNQEQFKITESGSYTLAGPTNERASFTVVEIPDPFA